LHFYWFPTSLCGVLVLILYPASSAAAPLSHTHLCHTPSVTHTTLSHTPSFTHSFVTHNPSHTTFRIIDLPPSPLSFLVFPCRSNQFFLIIGRGWLVGLSGPLIFSFEWLNKNWRSTPLLWASVWGRARVGLWKVPRANDSGCGERGRGQADRLGQIGKSRAETTSENSVVELFVKWCCETSERCTRQRSWN
jgi:hypothetical protein